MPFDNRTTELIAIGASIAANCQSPRGYVSSARPLRNAQLLSKQLVLLAQHRDDLVVLRLKSWQHGHHELGRSPFGQTGHHPFHPFHDPTSDHVAETPVRLSRQIPGDDHAS